MSDPQPGTPDYETAKAIESIRATGDRVEVETRRIIQQRTGEWMRNSMLFVATALGVMGFFGYSKLSDYMAEMKQNFDSINALAESSQKQFEVITRQVEAASIRVSEIDTRMQEAEQLLESLQQSRLQLEVLESSIDQRMNEVEVLKNSLMNVYIVYEGVNENATLQLQKILHQLKVAGFIVSPGDVLAADVTSNEIVFFAEKRPAAVDAIIKALQSELPAAVAIPVRQQLRGGRNEHDIAINLQL